MLLYLIRHGDPIYDPDSLTEQGHLQAEALSKRLSVLGFDRIYCSSSNRAVQTARPTCEKLGMEMELLDWCNEKYTFEEFAVPTADGKKNWAYSVDDAIKLLVRPEIIDLGKKWYESPLLKGCNFKNGVLRIARYSDEFLASLGYLHMPEENVFRVTEANDMRIALFAHNGLSLAFLSHILDIPYPIMGMRFYTQHTGVTVIDFKDRDGICIPRVFQLSNDSHLYKEGLPTKYMNTIDI